MFGRRLGLIPNADVGLKSCIEFELGIPGRLAEWPLYGGRCPEGLRLNREGSGISSAGE